MHIKGYVGHPRVLHGHTPSARRWLRHLHAPKSTYMAGSGHTSFLARARPPVRPSWVALRPVAMHGRSAYDGQIPILRTLTAQMAALAAQSGAASNGAQLISNGQQLVSSGEQLGSNGAHPSSSGKQLRSGDERLSSVGEQPSDSSQQLHSSREQPISSSEQPLPLDFIALRGIVFLSESFHVR